jgi:hypothetical protein
MHGCAGERIKISHAKLHLNAPPLAILYNKFVAIGDEFALHFLKDFAFVDGMSLN